MNEPLWSPSPERFAEANLFRFARQVERDFGTKAADYDTLYAWSVREPEQFWSALWDFCEVIGDKGERVLLDADRMWRTMVPGCAPQLCGEPTPPP